MGRTRPSRRRASRPAMDTQSIWSLGALADFVIAALFAAWGALLDHPAASVMWVLGALLALVRIWNMVLDTRLKARELARMPPPEP
jgi:hypothetical protein